MTRRSLILVGILACTPLAAFADMARANAAFRDGRYEAVLAETASTLTADAQALRARTLLAKTMCGAGDPDTATIKAALAAADAAISLDAGHIEGRLQKAIALSLLTRPMSLSEANESGYGPKAKALAEGVLKDEPDNHYALGFLAVWNVEVHRRAGSLGAAIVGASLKAARTDYAEAVKIAPDDPGLRWQWARALAAFDAKKYRGEIEAELKAALSIDPETELDRVMQGRAAALLDVVKTAKAGEIEKTALGML